MKIVLMIIGLMVVAYLGSKADHALKKKAAKEAIEEVLKERGCYERK